MSKTVLLPGAAQSEAGAVVRLDGEKLKHLRRVLRMDWLEHILVSDGTGRLLDGVLEELSDGGAVRLGTVRRTSPQPQPLELIVALPKNSTMDWLVEKAVECGATRILPVVSSRGIVKPDRGDAAKYVRRWQAIMDGAVEQSEQLWRPTIAAPVSWSEFLAAAKLSASSTKSFAFISELRVEANAEAQALTATWKALESTRNNAVRLILGPEGGFAEQERTDLVEHGFIPLSLGSAVLRVETAVVAALTLARVIRVVSST